jgi:hypothetical protein
VKALAVVILIAAPAFAEPIELLARLPPEPPVRALMRAAERAAQVSPERVRSWLSRVNKAALLPVLRFRVGRGAFGLSLSAATADSWRFEIESTWQLDRLIFDRNELGLGRETQRAAARRELIQNEVAELYFARRRLQLEQVARPQDPEAAERQLALDELTAILDGLTDGALTRSR